MEEKFTIEEIKNYIMKQDSLGDVVYNLSAENIRKANEPEESDEDYLEGYWTADDPDFGDPSRW